MPMPDADKIDNVDVASHVEDGSPPEGKAIMQEDPTTLRKQERRLVLKIDLFILPLIAMVYFFSSMGRSDLANAAVAGMREELNLSSQDYSNAANMFLVGYIFWQLPGTLLVRNIGPPRQFALAMITWGTVTAVTVTVKTTAQLLALRFLVGSAEAFIQGAVLYLSFFYTYRELATRAAVFYSMSSVAGAFNGVIAYAIEKNLNGHNGWQAWRWIFLIEGILPIGASVFVFILLPKSPDSAGIGFSDADRVLAVARSKRAHNNLEEKIEFKKIPLVLLSVSFWGFILISCCAHFATSSFSNFLPLIVRGFGYSKLKTQLFTVIVYVCAFVGLMTFGVIADRTNKRGFTIAAASCFTITGYALLIGLENSKGRFAATCITAFGAFPVIILQLSWMSMNVVGYTRRGTSLALSNVFSQIFAICGNQAYHDPPYYKNGNIGALGLTALSLVTSILLSLYFEFRNKQKRDAQSTNISMDQKTASVNEIAAQGAKHPDFFYTS